MKNIELNIWSEECVNEKDENKVYFRLLKNNSDLELCLVDYKGEEIENGLLLHFCHHKRVIIIFPSTSEQYPLKTDWSNMPLIVSHIEIQKIVEMAEKKLVNNMMKEILSHNHNEEMDFKNKTVN